MAKNSAKEQGKMSAASVFKAIDNVLKKPGCGCSGSLDYMEQSSWLLFLRYLDAREEERKVPPAAVMKCYDWATEMRDQGVCVMGGFQSPLERDVLAFLLQGKQPVIWVLAHKLWSEKSIPRPYREPIAAGRLLVVSPVARSVMRVDARTAAIRNRYILEHSERVVFAAIDSAGALARLVGGYPDLKYQVLA